MQTIKDFQEKMTLGSHWKTEVYHKIYGEFSLVNVLEDRRLSVKNNQSFGFETPRPDRSEPEMSGRYWPGQDEFIPLNDTAIAIVNDTVKFVYTFLHDGTAPKITTLRKRIQRRK